MPDLSKEYPLRQVARFYDRRQVGDVGNLGFRRSTNLSRLVTCLDALVHRGLLVPDKSLFFDLGCADGRVNVLLSYLVKASIGAEIDEWTLEEYEPLRRKLREMLIESKAPPPPPNIHLFHGDALEDSLHESIKEQVGIGIEDCDLFYTYLTMYQEFADLIVRKGKAGSIFMVYGLEKIMPRLDGLRLLTPEGPLGGIIALYQKP